MDRPVPLSGLPLYRSAIVASVEDRGADDAVARRLRELGFVHGEPVQVVAAGPIGAEPLLVQIGYTRFALRRVEAARVMVQGVDRDAAARRRHGQSHRDGQQEPGQYRRYRRRDGPPLRHHGHRVGFESDCCHGHLNEPAFRGRRGHRDHRRSGLLRLALIGNPNCGKTALFNRLTGSRQKVANYAGVTVERKEGRLLSPSGRSYVVLDLPGAYSLSPASLDEAVARDVCRGTYPGEPKPDALVCVIDATNLRLHLRFALEVRQLGLPMIVVLNMADAARRRGIGIDCAALAREFGVPVIETVAIRRDGAKALLAAIDALALNPEPSKHRLAPAADIHAETRRLLALAVRMPRRTARIDDALDRWLLHPVFGLLILAVVMFLIFQSVYVWAKPMQDGIGAGFKWFGEYLGTLLPHGPLNSLLVDGIIAGTGSVMVFLPLILILFAFILALEESGYLPRAAFLLDRMMSAAGLSGRSFIPLLSSFACAVPGIMSTRSIQDPRDRLTTILVAPLMTCSARLPVYALLIGAFIPQKTVLGVFNQQGLVLFALYAAGVLSALIVSFVMKKWRRDKGEHMLLMELPSYRLPNLRDLAIGLWERAEIFLKRVGGIILALTILLWFLLSFPHAPSDAAAPAIDYSFAGRIGHALTYVFAPIGFNWQICIALIPGLAAREVVVASLATVYALSVSDDAAAQALSPLIAHGWSLATALSLLVWFIYAPGCISTLATIRRETNSWKQTVIAAGYLFAMAYLASMLTYQIVSRLAGA